MMQRCGSIRLVSAAMLAASALRPLAAAAQNAPTRKWDIALQIGGLQATSPARGTSNVPGAGEPFTTAGIYGPPAPPVLVISTSRRQSSWYFGDGPVLFNQAATALAANPVAMTAPFPGRIVTLDPVLTRSLARGWRGGSIGGRVSRLLNPRLAVELRVDYSLTRLNITEENRNAVEATRASFIPAFEGLIASNSSRAVKSLTSTATLDGGQARALLTSGVLNINLRTTGRIIPYATAGAGVVSTIGRKPAVTLTGNYQFSNTTSGAQFNETDTVTVKDARDARSVLGVLGAGAKISLAPRWGVRLEAQAAVGRNPTATVVSTAPQVALGQLPAGRVTLNADPTIQFGNSAGPVTGLGVTALAPSTLTGPAIAELRTFSGRGAATHVSVTAGLFWRF